MKKKINNKTNKNITIGPFPSSEKIYIKGRIFSDLKVPARQINLSKKATPNKILIYDSSGVYSEFKKARGLLSWRKG